MTEAMRRLNKAPLMIRDQFTISIDQIALQCRKWKKTRDLKLVVIDYLQLIDRPRGATTNEAISEITRKLKNLSGDIETPIVLISQLNRLSDTDQRPPRLSDLRDSGSIEQDANLIFLLHPDGKERSKVHIIFAGRRCPSDSDTLLFHREINRFENEQVSE
jgi:replicative DNA helicase